MDNARKELKWSERNSDEGMIRNSWELVLWTLKTREGKKKEGNFHKRWNIADNTCLHRVSHRRTCATHLATDAYTLPKWEPTKSCISFVTLLISHIRFSIPKSISIAQQKSFDPSSGEIILSGFTHNLKLELTQQFTERSYFTLEWLNNRVTHCVTRQYVAIVTKSAINSFSYSFIGHAASTVNFICEIMNISFSMPFRGHCQCSHRFNSIEIEELTSGPSNSLIENVSHDSGSMRFII